MVQIEESPENLHQRRLEKLCRVCGQSLKHSRTLYLCEKYQEDLFAVFHFKVHHDSPDIHPCHFCEKCKSVLYKSQKAAKENRLYITSVRVHDWTVHGHQCIICSPLAGGRPKKERKNRVRPSLTSSHTIITQITESSPPSFLPPDSADFRPPYILPQSSGLKPEDIECSICTLILDQPVQLPCSTVVCRGCICRLV